MDFAEARTAFYTTRDDAGPVPSDTPARRLRDAVEPLAMVDIWSDAAAQNGAALGLDFLTAYVGGRGALLGDANGTVVAAAFGVFEPGFVADTWAAARGLCSVTALLELHERSATETLRAALDGVDTAEIDAIVDPLRAAIDAADLAGRPLFAGLRAQGWPTDPYARLWRAASALREHRGDAHLGACTAIGVDGLAANMLTELWVGYPLLEYSGTRAWPQEAMDAAVARLERRGFVADGALTAEGRRVRDGVEAATDAAQQEILDALGGRVEAVIEATSRWSEAVVAKGWFPPDPYKRAAG